VPTGVHAQSVSAPPRKVLQSDGAAQPPRGLAAVGEGTTPRYCAMYDSPGLGSQCLVAWLMKMQEVVLVRTAAPLLQSTNHQSSVASSAVVVAGPVQ